MFLPPVGLASLHSSGRLCSVPCPCKDIAGALELALPFPSIHLGLTPTLPGTPQDHRQRARSALCKCHGLCKCVCHEKEKANNQDGPERASPQSLANRQLMILRQPRPRSGPQRRRLQNRLEGDGGEARSQPDEPLRPGGGGSADMQTAQPEEAPSLA